MDDWDPTLHTLAEGSLSQDLIANACSKELRSLLSVIVGFQNDLTGLDKDLSIEWPLNAVLVMESLRTNRPGKD